MEMKLKMKMKNNIDIGRDQSYLKYYVFVFREICDIGIDTILDTLYRNFIDYNYIA